MKLKYIIQITKQIKYKNNLIILLQKAKRNWKTKERKNKSYQIK